MFASAVEAVSCAYALPLPTGVPSSRWPQLLRRRCLLSSNRACTMQMIQEVLSARMQRKTSMHAKAIWNK